MRKLGSVWIIILLLCCSRSFSEETECKKYFFSIMRGHSENNFEKKIQDWKKFKDKCSKDNEYEMYLADAYYSTNRLKKAKKLYENILLKDLSMANIHTAEELLVRIDLLEGNKTSAVEKIFNLLHKYPEWYMGYALMGRFELENGNVKKAKDFFNKSNSLEDNFDSYAGMAIVHYFENKYLDSLLAYQKTFDLEKTVVLDRAATTFAVRSAIKEKRWGGAQSILDLQKKFDKTIESHKPYQELRAQREC